MLREVTSINDPKCFVNFNDVVSINELKVNPFCFRLCKAFAQDNATYLMFEEFLDMMSVMSEAAPAQVIVLVKELK